AALVVVAALFFRRVLFGGQVFFSRDIAPFFYPMKAYLVDSIRSGRLPLWNPWVLNGEPFFATLQPGALYPGSLLLYVLPFSYAFGLLLALHYPLAGVGFYLLLRRWQHGRAAALLGGLAFMLGGYLVSVGNFYNNIQTVAWIPWIWLAWDRYVESATPGRFVVFVLATACGFLGGEPQMLAIGLGVLVAHELMVGRSGPRRLGAGRQLGWLAAAGLLALGLVAVQLLPFLELLRHSIRNTDLTLSFAARRSAGFRTLVNLLVPPAVSTGQYGFSARYLLTPEVPWLVSVYPGVLVLGFAAQGVARPRSRPWLWFWAGLGLAGLLLALGPATPVFPFLFRWLPPLRLVRYPEKFFFLTAVALAVLAARGFDTVREDGARRSGPVLAALGALAVLYGALWVLLHAVPDLFAMACGGAWHGAQMCRRPAEAQRFYGGLLVRALLLTVAGVALLGGWRLRRVERRLAVPLLLVLAAVDLGVTHDCVNPTVSRGIYEHRPWAATVLDRVATDRQAYRYRGSTTSTPMGSALMVPGALELTNMYIEFQAMGPDLGQLYHHPSQDGIQGVELKSVVSTIAFALHNPPDVRTRLLRAMNVKYYVDPTPTADSMPGLRPLEAARDLPLRMYTVENPVPRAYLVSRYRVQDNPVTAFGKVIGPDFDLRGEAVLGDSLAEAPDSAATGHVLESRYGSEEVRLRTRTSGRMVLVLTDRFYPGWTASVDGRPAGIHRANGFFRAIAVPAGTHEVVFRYRPRAVVVGAWISAVSVLVCLNVFLLGRRRRS
ncbi:MAG TPA: YfhO family protein, partial [Longimicrobiales bacterium]|nr:YfhO family protein [Longimicrobiales bacterium]